MTSKIYTLLDEVVLPNSEAIAAVDLVKSTNRGKDFGRACQYFAGLVRHSEEKSKASAQIELLSKVSEQTINTIINRNKDDEAEKTAEPTDEELADALLSRGFANDLEFGVSLVDKFETMRAHDKSIVSYLNAPLSDLAWAQMGWEDKQKIAANYAVFFTRK
jgi:hypothetical protein